MALMDGEDGSTAKELADYARTRAFLLLRMRFGFELVEECVNEILERRSGDNVWVQYLKAMIDRAAYRDPSFLEMEKMRQTAGK